MNAFLRRSGGRDGRARRYKYDLLGESRSDTIWTKKKIGLIMMFGTIAAVVGVVGVVG